MPRYRLDLDAVPDWAPLERLCRLCCENADLPSLEPSEFMYMGRLLHGRLPPIHLYKHVDTRRYLDLDDAGHAFAVRCHLRPTGGVRVTCRPYRNLSSALQRLEVGWPTARRS